MDLFLASIRNMKWLRSNKKSNAGKTYICVYIYICIFKFKFKATKVRNVCRLNEN